MNASGNEMNVKFSDMIGSKSALPTTPYEHPMERRKTVRVSQTTKTSALNSSRMRGGSTKSKRVINDMSDVLSRAEVERAWEKSRGPIGRFSSESRPGSRVIKTEP